jgi:DNA polymerase-3 subunit alpha
MAEPSFIHLRVHTEYSLVDGIVRIGSLIGKSAEYGMPAVAITDVCNFFALVKFFKAARGAGIKPICGSDFQVAPPAQDAPPSQVTLLVQNGEGYRNLTRLISRAYLEGQVQGRPMLRREWLAELGEGLIVLSGGRQGDVGQALLANRREQAQALLDDWRRDFPDRYYLELTRTGRDGEEDYLHRAVELAGANRCPVVATNDVCFLEREQFDAHEARVCINEGRTLDDPRRERRYSPQQYLRSAEEMAELFSDIPEALANSVEIAKRCSLELELGKHYLPEYPIPAGFTTETYFEKLSFEGLEKRLATLDVESAAR